MRRFLVACWRFVLVYAISAEWLGSVAGITGAYLLGYVFAGSEYKADVERSFYALGHGLLIPLFFVSIGLSSDYRALSGHWILMLVVLLVAVVGKVVGCGLAALGSGMDWVRSLRIGCGMMSRGEVGLIVTAMGASTGIFGEPEVAVMVAVVLLTTLLTPIALRGTFNLKSPQDMEEELKFSDPDLSGRWSAGWIASNRDRNTPIDPPFDQSSMRVTVSSSRH